MKKTKLTLEQLKARILHLETHKKLPKVIKDLIQKITDEDTNKKEVSPSQVRKHVKDCGCDGCRIALRSLAIVRREKGPQIALSTIEGLL